MVMVTKRKVKYTKQKVVKGKMYLGKGGKRKI